MKILAHPRRSYLLRYRKLYLRCTIIPASWCAACKCVKGVICDDLSQNLQQEVQNNCSLEGKGMGGGSKSPRLRVVYLLAERMTGTHLKVGLAGFASIWQIYRQLPLTVHN